jgi:ribokinase
LLICALGDLILDVIVRLERPLARGDDTLATTVLSPGGQAANVAVWAVELGGQARLVTKFADDEPGRLLATELERRGVEVVGPTIGGRTGVVVSLVDPDGDRSMASDRGAGAALSPDELDDGWFECDALHVSGYALVLAERAAAAARSYGARISVDLSAESLIDGTFRERLRRVAPDVVFATEREVAAAGEIPGATIVLKRGPRGLSVDGEAFPARPVEAVDSTGAGDALAAGFLVGGPELGLEAAARCVAQVGAMP